MAQHTDPKFMKGDEPYPIGRAEQAAAYVLKRLDLIKPNGEMDFEALYRRTWYSYHEQPIQWDENLGDDGEPTGPCLDHAKLAAALKAMYPSEATKEMVYGMQKGKSEGQGQAVPGRKEEVDG
jgi:hypothetical protein